MFCAAFSVFLDKPLPRRFPCRRIRPFSRTPLYDLHSPAHSEIVPIFPQRPSQALYRYNQFCFHKYKILFSKFRAPDVNQR